MKLQVSYAAEEEIIKVMSQFALAFFLVWDLTESEFCMLSSFLPLVGRCRGQGT